MVWPSWCNGIDEAPWELVSVVSHGLFILAASSNLSAEEQPEQWMWAFDEEISAHFDRVKDQRKQKMNPNQEEDGPGWKRNELAKELLGE